MFHNKPKFSAWKPAILLLVVALTQGGLGFTTTDHALNRKSSFDDMIMQLHARVQQDSEEGVNNKLDGHQDSALSSQRRNLLLSSLAMVATTTLNTRPAHAARYVMDEETGDYVEVEEEDWQSAWKGRWEKASSMSQDEIFQAARGAGNLNLKEGMEESPASKKRRAMSACRDATVRSKANAGSEKDCTARVFGGEVDFLLDAL